MAKKTRETKPAASLGDDLDRGRGRDKNPYPDPAAAPLGTDDEAAGTPVTTEQTRMARDHEIRSQGGLDSTSPTVLHDRETRQFDTDPTLQPPPAAGGPTHRWVVYTICALAVVVLLWALIWR